MTVRYDKLIPREIDGVKRLVIAPADYTGEHELVLIRREVCGVEVKIIMEARGNGERLSQPEAVAAAAQRTAYGFAPLQAPSPEVAFLACDRSQYPALPESHFPDINDRWWTWTDTVDAEDPSDYAWAVLLGGGSSGRDPRSDHLHVRACCPSQDLLALGEEAGS